MSIYAQQRAYAIQTLALHNLGPSAGEKTFALIGENTVKVIGHNGVEHSVAQKFQAFIVGPAAIGQFHGATAMHHGQFVQFNVARIETSNAMNKNVKLLILYKKELYE